MSYKEKIRRGRFLAIIFEEHRFAVSSARNLHFQFNCTSKCPSKCSMCNTVLLANIYGKMKTVICLKMASETAKRSELKLWQRLIYDRDI